MRCAAWLAFVVACGSAPSAPAPVVANQPAGPAPATCADVGIILRGSVDQEGAAGPEREAAIAKSCETERWSRDVIACVAGTPRPLDCVDKLDARQREEYERRLQHWADKHGTDIQGYRAGDHRSDVDLSALMIACDEAVGDPARYGPALDPEVPEREWDLKVRKAALHDECDHGWNEDLKTCVRDAADGAAVEACLGAHLEAGEHAELAKKLTEIDQLARKIAAARKKPATLGCKQVVAAHYGDRQWKSKLDGYKADERKRMIADSRTKMTKACTADAWDEVLRACVVAGGGDPCFKSFGMGMRWGYPAAGVVIQIGVAECDAYGAALAKLATCDKVPQSARDSLVDAFEQMRAHIAALPAAERAQLASGCKAGLEALAQIASSTGC